MRSATRSAILAVSASLMLGASALAGEPTHGLALYGDLKYGPNFTHFDYVNPDAPKGGTLRLNAIGTYDNFNAFALKGVKADGIGNIFDTLMAGSADEPDSEYGLIAESVAVAPDRLSVTFNLRKEARFRDGSPVTPEDVIWTFNTLKEKGDPFYHVFYADVVNAEKTGERSVKFTFRSAENRKLPLNLGGLAILSKAYWATHDFEKPSLDIPLTSGPYTIDSFDPGRSVTYKLVPDYWAKDLPVNRGRNNFEIMRYDYYRDASVALEAFKAGQYDFRNENVSKNWAVGYASPALSAGLFKMEAIKNEVPQGMQGFVMNARRPLFQDPRVRAALDYLWDFEWTNKNLFYGAYTRTQSYFSNSDLASSGLPSADELKILEKYKGQIPDEVFTTAYAEPKTDGSGNIRDNLRKALELLKVAGWTIKNGQLTNETTGKPFEFEFITAEPEFERIILPFGQNLLRAGIKMNLRNIDPAQYQNRLQNFDYDMTVSVIPEALSPGDEERTYWTSAAADEMGSNNIIGVKNKAIDDLVDMIIAAPTRPDLLTRVHALDRILLASHYVIPNYHITAFRAAYWDKFGRPKINPPYALALDAWWIDPDKDKNVGAKKDGAGK